LILDATVREQRRLGLVAWMEQHQDQPYLHEHEINHTQRLIDYLDVVKTPHREAFDMPRLLNDFHCFFTQYDQRRGKDFGSAFPSLKEWYDNLQIQQQ
jgi:hypothetical protein